jgi:hypothetical protein
MTCSCVVSHLFIHHNSFFFFFSLDVYSTDLEWKFCVCFYFSHAHFCCYFFSRSIKEQRDRYRKNIKTHQKNITFYTLFFSAKDEKEKFFYIANRNEIYDFLYLERWMRCTDVWMDIATVYTQKKWKFRICDVICFKLS